MSRCVRGVLFQTVFVWCRVSDVAELNTQGTAVTWDDPRERQARNNLLSEEAARQDTENVSPNVPPAAGPAKRPAPVLVFSGLEPAERARYAALAGRLGGSVLDSATLEPSATHLVTTRPNRSEKHLAAVASGRWLLQPAYLDACERAGHFIQVRPPADVPPAEICHSISKR